MIKSAVSYRTHRIDIDQQHQHIHGKSVCDAIKHFSVSYAQSITHVQVLICSSTMLWTMQSQHQSMSVWKRTQSLFSSSFGRLLMACFHVEHSQFFTHRGNHQRKKYFYSFSSLVLSSMIESLTIYASLTSRRISSRKHDVYLHRFVCCCFSGSFFLSCCLRDNNDHNRDIN
jgi:hypothetical protein